MCCLSIDNTYPVTFMAQDFAQNKNNVYNNNNVIMLIKNNDRGGKQIQDQIMTENMYIDRAIVWGFHTLNIQEKSFFSQELSVVCNKHIFSFPKSLFKPKCSSTYMSTFSPLPQIFFSKQLIL